MKLFKISHLEKKIFFKTPYNVDGVHIIEYKHSDQLKLFLKSGNRDIILESELSYLPHFHQKNYNDILNELHTLTKKLPLDIHELKELSLSPMLDFAIWGAFFLSQNPLGNVPLKINGLYQLNIEQSDISRFQVVKIKIARGNPTDEVREIKKIFKKLPNTRFRLDANGGLNHQTIRPYLELDLSRIDYFEEPFKYLEQYSDDRFPLPSIALDENILPFLERSSHIKNLVALVIKPSCYGIAQTLKIINYAKKHQLKIIFSHTFETSVGLSIIKSLAQFYAPDECHGLINWPISLCDFLTMTQSAIKS